MQYLTGITCLLLAAGGMLAAGAGDGCPLITHVRILPRPGSEEKLVRGRITGSNEGATVGFETLAEVKQAPAPGAWAEVSIPKPVRYRFVKFESANGSYANVAELEFRTAEGKAQGQGFGTTGSRNNSGADFSKALDGDPITFFEGAEPNNQYVGLDFGPASQTAAPVFTPPPGTYPQTTNVSLSTATPGAVIRYVRGSGKPSADHGEMYKQAIPIERGSILVAVATAENLAASAPVIASYRIGQPRADARLLRTFHIGNSLTDTVDGWLKPVAESAGRALEFHRFTIPGAPTDWLWNHPGSGFGDSRYAEAFFAFAPFDHLVLQPFAGHGRSIQNEAEHIGKFYELCRRHSPQVKLWVYQQWPSQSYDEAWSKGNIPLGGKSEDWSSIKVRPGETFADSGTTLKTGVAPANWETAVQNHSRYFEILLFELQRRYPGQKIDLIPAGPALARVKAEIEAGRLPGNFFPDHFSDGVHLTPKGRYLVSLVHYACLYNEDPSAKAGALNTGLSEEQAKVYQAIAWETAAGRAARR